MDVVWALVFGVIMAAVDRGGNGARAVRFVSSFIAILVLMAIVGMLGLQGSADYILYVLKCGGLIILSVIFFLCLGISFFLQHVWALILSLI